MKKKLVILTGILIMSFVIVNGVSAQEKGSQEKAEVKKELTDKQLRKKLGMTKEEFAKIPEKCKNCPGLLKCKGQAAATAVTKKNEGEKAGECAEESEAAGTENKVAVRGKKTVKKK